MLTKRRVLVAKIETTEGTGETLAVGDGGILAIDPKVDVDIKMHERNVVKASLSRLKQIPGGQLARLTFKAELKGAGAAYSASIQPALGKYLRACGFSETIVTTPGAETVTYQPASTGLKTLTLALYEDGVIKKIIGARGNVKLSGANGEPIFADFDFLGIWDGMTDGAMLAPTYEGTIPPVLLSSVFTIAAFQSKLSSFEIDMANMLSARSDVSKATGYFSTIISGRNPIGRFDPEAELVATHDFFGRWKAGTSGALVAGPVGATQYNKFKIDAPVVVYTKVSDADREGQAIADTNFQLAQNTGDDEIVILFN